MISNFRNRKMVQTSNFRTEKNSKMSNFRTKAIHHSFIIPKSDQLFARIIAIFLPPLLHSYKIYNLRKIGTMNQ